MIQTSTRPRFRQKLRNLAKMFKHKQITEEQRAYYEAGIREARRTEVIDDSLEGVHDKR